MVTFASQHEIIFHENLWTHSFQINAKLSVKSCPFLVVVVTSYYALGYIYILRPYYKSISKQ